MNISRVKRPITKATKTKTTVTGLTLIEVMVSLAIALFVLTLVINSLLSLNRAFVFTEQLVRVQESLRFAQHQLQLPLNKSQFWFKLQGLLNYSGSISVNHSQAPSCDKDKSDWAFHVWQPISALNNNRSHYECISASSYRDSDILTLRHLKRAELIDAPANPFIRLHQTQAKFFRGNDHEFSINQFPDVNAATYAVISQTFYLANSNRTCNGVAIPALYRKYLSNGLPKTEEVASGIEHLELLFDIDRDDDGDIDHQVAADQVVAWQLVRSISVHLIARSECELSGPPVTTRFNVAETEMEFSDKFLRESLVFTVAL
ncbi:PilW family protein [Thalassotalea litorea]|uniref:PilW family protein n=1 Tax=Thalassotalea litorea TaxID=2020715 RepID=UPI0037368172